MTKYAPSSTFLRVSLKALQRAFGPTKGIIMSNQGNRNQGDTSNRGFASMDEDKQREIASKGGRAAHESGNAHEFDSEEAREAGRKGGEAVSQDREHMSEIGRKGGEARGGNQGGSHGGNRGGNQGGGRR
jgi:general stress protein YciG